MIWEQWRMIEQACAEMSQVSIRIAYRYCPLVDLNDVHALPWDLLVGQCAQHQPRRVTATDRHDEAPPRRNRCTRVDRDDRRRLAGDQIVIRMDFDLHVMTSGWDTPMGTVVGSHRLSLHCGYPVVSCCAQRTDFSKCPPNS